MDSTCFKHFLLPKNHFSGEANLVCLNGNIDFSNQSFESLVDKYKKHADTIILTDEVLNVLHGICKWQLPTFPSSAHVQAYATLTKTEDTQSLPWQKILGTKEYFEACMQYAKTILKSLNSTPGVRYAYEIAYLTHTKKVLKKLGHSLADNKRIKEHASQSTTSLAQKEILRTFICKPSNPSWDASRNLLYPPQSTLASSRTGRSSYVSGPNLGHLQKEFRNIITSRFGEDGNVWYLDYTSLEPRVLLYLSQALDADMYNSLNLVQNNTLPICVWSPNNDVSSEKEEGQKISKNSSHEYSKNWDGDIYKNFVEKNKLTDKGIPRHVIKTAIISVLYGQSQKNFEDSLKQYISDPDELYEGVEEFFKVRQIKQLLVAQLESSDGIHLTNYYGRPVYPDNAKAYALVNYYIQSTAVDVAMFGFQNVINGIAQLKRQEHIIPIFLLHDAIILDVHKCAEHQLPELEACGSTNIPGFDNKNFYLRASKL